jgi:hypothetical protein
MMRLFGRVVCVLGLEEEEVKRTPPELDFSEVARRTARRTWTSRARASLPRRIRFTATIQADPAVTPGRMSPDS